MIAVEACLPKMDPSNLCKSETRIKSVELSPDLHTYDCFPQKLVTINKYFLIKKNYNFIVTAALTTKTM